MVKLEEVIDEEFPRRRKALSKARMMGHDTGMLLSYFTFPSASCALYLTVAVDSDAESDISVAPDESLYERSQRCKTCPRLIPDGLSQW